MIAIPNVYKESQLLFRVATQSQRTRPGVDAQHRTGDFDKQFVRRKFSADVFGDFCSFFERIAMQDSHVQQFPGLELLEEALDQHFDLFFACAGLAGRFNCAGLVIDLYEGFQV